MNNNSETEKPEVHVGSGRAASRFFSGKMAALPFVAVFALIGVYTLVSSFAATTTSSLFPANATPAHASADDSLAVEVGVKFKSDVNGSVSGVRFYKASDNTGTHVGNLWTANGTNLARATFTGESGSGWQTVTFAQPVAIKANTVYVASYHTNVGHYAYSYYGLIKPVNSSPLHAVADGDGGPDGVYTRGSTSAFPTSGYQASNYWVDVIFNASSTADTTDPTVSLTTPGNNASVSGAVTVSANASDNVGVSKVEFYVDGSLKGTVTNAPYQYNLDTTTLTNGSHSLTAKAYDAANHVATSAATAITVNNTVAASCLTSTTGWQNSGIGAQTGTYTVSFNVTPNQAKIDGVTGLSNGKAAGYNDLAAIVRFNDTNTIDVRNGGAYNAATRVSYTPGTEYRVRMVVNSTAHTYSVFVTPAGGTETALATNYAFRSEQATTSTLDTLAVNSSVGTHKVCNFAMSSPDVTPPTAPTNLTATLNNDGGTTTTPTPLTTPTGLTATAASSTQVNLTWNAVTGATRYVVLRGGVVVATPNAASYSDTTVIANTSYSYQVEAQDAANSTTSPSTAVSVKTPAAADTVAPPVPTGLSATSPGPNQINLTWNAVTDTGGSGLAGYNIYRNGTKVATSTTASYGDGTLTASTKYTYTVSAYDGTGNTSAQTAAISVTTQAASTGGTGTATTNCVNSPHACGFPDATNTGVPAGTTLTTVNGGYSSSSDGQVISGLDIHGTLTIKNSNVTVKNTKVTGGGGSSWAINVTGGSGVVIEDCTIDSGKSDQGGITGNGFSMYRCDISNGENAARPGSNALIEDSYMHTFRSSSSGPHYDGVELYGGSGAKIVHNTIILDQTETSAVNAQGDFGTVSNTVIDHNLLDGGGYILNIRSIGKNPVTGTQITNNHFGPHHAYGNGAVDSGTTSTVSGNIDDATGKAIGI